MSGISAPITDLLAKIATLELPNLSGATVPVFTRIWNNQLANVEEGNSESYPFPNAFLEVLMPNDYTQLAMGWTESDIIFRVHIAMWEADAMDGTMEQNLTIFDFRDQMIRLLTYYQPASCGNLMKVSEQQDYSHTNIYHYIIDFKCAFIDNIGDVTATQITSGPPTTLTTVAGFYPVEILSVEYDSGAGQITAYYRVNVPQSIHFTFQGVDYSAGQQAGGDHQITLDDTFSLPTGNYFITSTAETDLFTTKPFLIIVP